MNSSFETDRESFGLCRGNGFSDARIERTRAITLRHLGERDDLDPGSVARGAELLEPLTAEVAHRIHGGLKKLARVEFTLCLRGHLADDRGHRQAAVGVNIDLAHALLDATDDLLDRYPPGLRHLAAKLVEHVL